MTVSTAYSGPQTSACNGSTTSFPVAFQYADKSGLVVELVDDATGAATVLTEGTDYTRSGDGMSAPSSITTLTAYPAGKSIRRSRATPREQTLLAPPNSLPPSSLMERAWDRAMLAVQELDADLAKVFGRLLRTWQVPGDGSRDGKFPVVLPGGGLGWASGTGADGALREDLASEDGIDLVNGLKDALDRVVTPIDRAFGAVGDGVTDDRLALKAALESGKKVDGLNRTYAIDGTLTPASLAGLRNARLVQIGNRTTANVQTLRIIGLSDWTLENVVIDMGASIDTLFSDDGTSGLYVGGTDATTYAERFQISNVRVTGNGCGAGIQIRHAKRFVVHGCIVHDRLAGSTPDPTNDSQNGIELVNCANFALANCEVNNLRTRLGGTPTTKWTRGFTIVECRDGAITGCVAIGCDQNYDFSGAYVSTLNWIGNARLTVSGCISANAGTYGFKFANVTRDCLVTGCLAANSGRIGFVFSPSNVALPAGLEKLNTQNIDVVGCKVVNVLGTSWAGAGAEGFRLMSNPTYPSWPQGIRLKACHVADTQDVPTTTVAYSSDVVPLDYPAAYVPSYLTECTADATVPNFTTSDFGKNAAIATGSAAISIAHSSWADVTFDVDVVDPQALHSVTSNTQRIYVRDTGWYDVQALIRFAMNGTGLRQARLKKNNVVIDRTTASVAGSAVSASSLVLSAFEFARAGDYFSIEVFQNSGGALNLQADESRFTVRAA